MQRGGSIIHTDSPQKTMDLAEGSFLRACFEQEQQLTRLAIEAAKTSMLVFAQAHRRKDLQSAQRRWCAEMRGRMNAVDQKLDEQDRFLKKEIDKTPKNGYILCINAMKKSVHRRQLSREPGQVKQWR